MNRHCIEILNRLSGSECVLLSPFRSLSVVVGRLIVACRSVDSCLSVAAQSPLSVLPKSSHLIFLYIIYFRSVCRNTLIFIPENFFAEGPPLILADVNQSLSFYFSVHLSHFSRSFFDHFSIAARSFLDHRSMYRTRSVLVGSMYRPSGYTQSLNYRFTNSPYGFLKLIPQYFPRPPN